MTREIREEEKNKKVRRGKNENLGLQMCWFSTFTFLL